PQVLAGGECALLRTARGSIPHNHFKPHDDCGATTEWLSTGSLRRPIRKDYFGVIPRRPSLLYEFLLRCACRVSANRTNLVKEGIARLHLETKPVLAGAR